MSLTELAPARESGVMCQRPWPLLVVGVCSGNIDLRLKQVLKPWRSGLESWSHVNDFPSRIEFQVVIRVFDVHPNQILYSSPCSE